jgi:Fe2+ transport system protein B
MSENPKENQQVTATGMQGAVEAIRTLKGRVGEGVEEGSPASVEGVIPESPPEVGSEPQYADKTQNRIHHLAQQRDEARTWAERLSSENQRLRGFAEEQHAAQQQNAVANMEAQKREQLKRLAFKEEYPESGTDEDKASWNVRKEAHQIATKQTVQGLSAFATMLAPTFAKQAHESRERDWGQVEQSLNQYGVGRGEVEGTVNAIMQQEPHRSLRSAVFDALDMHGHLGAGAGAVPTVATPGRGRTEPASAAPQAPTEQDHLLGLMDLAKQQGEANRPNDSLRTLAEVFNKGRALAQE